MGKLLMVLAVLLPAAGSAQDKVPFVTGLQLTDPSVYSTLPLADVPLMGVLPSVLDLSPRFAPPGDQGRQGSCVAWAVAYALKSYQERREIGWSDSEFSRFSPAYIYNQVKVNGCLGGAYYYAALNLLTKRGAASWGDFGYDPDDCQREPSEAEHKRAYPFHAAGWRRVNTLDEAEVKSHIAAGDPVLIGMRVDRAFMDLKPGAVYQGPPLAPLGGHALVVTGYDDSRGAFKVINSWGATWADRGYGWIAYTSFTDPARRAVLEGYVVLDAETSPRPVPGEAGFVVAAATAPTSRLFEIVASVELPIGERAVTKGTANHHCSSNCAGEPTRTNYQLTLTASAPNRRLRNPRLKCLSGSCPWSAVVSVRLEDHGRTAISSWDVWGTPSTWELRADEIEVRERSRSAMSLDVGQKLTVNTPDGQAPPIIAGELGDGSSFLVHAGQATPVGAALVYVGREGKGGMATYTYVVKE